MEKSYCKTEEYLTVKELSERIKYEIQSIYNLIHRGQFILGIHYLKPSPKKILFKWSEIKKWIGDTSNIQNAQNIAFDDIKLSTNSNNKNEKHSKKGSINI